jgi:hypothetical protein
LYGNDWKTTLNVDDKSNQIPTDNIIGIAEDDSCTLETYLYDIIPEEEDLTSAAALNILKTCTLVIQVITSTIALHSN